MNYISSIIAVLFLVVNTAWCATNYEELLSELDAHKAQVTTVSFTFAQTIAIPLSHETQSAHGTVLYKQPNKVCMKHTKPFRQTIVTNGVRLWVYNPDEKQVAIKQYASLMEQNQTLYFFDFVLYKADTLRTMYRCTVFFNEKTEYVLALKPKRDPTTTIQLAISKDTLFPRRIEITGKDTVITTHISRLKSNITLDDNTFEFAVPKGTQIWNMEAE